MKVLQVGKFYPPHRGGIETYVASLCDELKSRVEVEVLVSSDDGHGRTEEINGVRIRRLPTWFTIASAAVGPGLVRALRQSDADIVHLHFPHPAAILAWLASGNRAPLVIGYHSDIIRQKFFGAVFTPLLRATLRRASAIVVLSAQYIRSSSILPGYSDRCAVIPHGVRLAEFDRVGSDSAERIRSEAGPRIVLAIGRLVSYKGFEYLIRAMRLVDARLIIIGDGPLREALASEAKMSGVKGKVMFIRDAEDLRPYYYAADVFVLPSVTRAEGFGIVQLEAMACGKPVVNTALDTGVVFASVDGETGLTVPPRDSSALAAAINTLLGDAALRTRLGTAARERVRREFTVEQMAERTLRLYERILSTPVDSFVNRASR